MIFLFERSINKNFLADRCSKLILIPQHTIGYIDGRAVLQPAVIHARSTANTVNKYLPYSDSNAVQEAAIRVHFHGQFDPQQIESARGRIKAHYQDELPNSQEMFVTGININMVGQDTPKAVPDGIHRLAGFEFSKPKSDGGHARLLRFSEETLLSSFLKYPGWKETLRDSLGYIKAVLSSIPMEGTPVVAFGLRYVDRFTFEGSIDAPRADMLFAEDSKFLAAHCFDAGPLWHCHSGWFDDGGAGTEACTLNQLKVSSGIVDQSSTAIVDHDATWQLQYPRQSLEAVLSPPDGEIGFEDALNHLHEKNKEILGNLLRQDMLEKIGMRA